MRIVQPSVKLEGLHHQVIFNEETEEYSPVQGPPEKLIELGARNCYKSEDCITPTSYVDFVDRVVNQRHHVSVSEHSYATFRIVCDRGVMAEITRHRIASFSIESTRYANYSKDKFGGEITVLEPPGLRGPNGEVTPAFGMWQSACLMAEEMYLKMLDQGLAPQIARSVLPNSLKTEIIFSANFSSLHHFLTLRTSPAAHPQMREIANLIKDILIKVAPVIFKEFANKSE